MNKIKYLFLLSITMMIGACGEEVKLDSEYSPESKLVITPTTSNDVSSLRVGESCELKADFNYTFDGDVQWSSTSSCVKLTPKNTAQYWGDPVKNLFESCNVECLSQGTAIITARAGDKEAQFKIEVTAPLVANFTVDTNNYQEVTFSITENTSRYDSFKWDFGDGYTNTSYRSVYHTYSSGGTYVVSLTLKSNKYGTDTKTKTITVSEPTSAPSAYFTYYTDGYTIELYNKTTGATSYYWDFGDGTYSYSKSTTHTYSKKGYYTVTLTASNKHGSRSAATKSIYFPVTSY